MDLFRDAIERSPLPLLRTDGPHHVVRYANATFCALCGLDKDSIIGRPLADCVPGGDDGHIPLLDKVFRDGEVQSGNDLKHINSAGDAVYWSYVAWPVEAGETGDRGLVIQVTDTTARAIDGYRSTRLAADLLEVNVALVRSGIDRDEAAERAETAERELRKRQEEVEHLNERLRRAMTETHHRVKNNLQIIAGLIDLRVMENEEVVPVEAVQRLGLSARALATLHDILTAKAKDDGDPESISVSNLLEKLVPILQEVSRPHQILADIAECRIPSRGGAALALILSELVSNSIKYGKDEIKVVLSFRSGTAALEVSDNGAGFPEGFDSATAANTGLELVESLTRWDLGGEVAYGNAPAGGARVTINFKAAESACESPDDPISLNDPPPPPRHKSARFHVSRSPNLAAAILTAPRERGRPLGWRRGRRGRRLRSGRILRCCTCGPARRLR